MRASYGVFAASQAVWDSASAEVSIEESACFFGPHKRLFGVISHALKRAHGDAAPAVLLLSGGFNHHVGQNRMFTRWARAWAAQGMTCLRFDLAGFGDSRVPEGEAEGQLHSLASIADLQAAMDHLAAVSGARRFAIVGLCSGAFIGFHTALADDRVASLALLNWTRFYPSGESLSVRSKYRSLRFYLTALSARRTWQKLLRGRVDALGITKHFLSGVVRRLRSSVLPRLPADNASRLAHDMRRLAGRGLKSLIVSTTATRRPSTNCTNSWASRNVACERSACCGSRSSTAPITFLRRPGRKSDWRYCSPSS